MWTDAILLGCLWCIAGLVTSEWTEWSNWTNCSRRCGGGISSQTRGCRATTDAPEAECSGQNKRYRVCETQSCLFAEVDLSSDLCSSLNDVKFDGNTIKWQSLSRPGTCYVSCLPVSGHGLNSVYLAQPDGTKCNLPSSASSAAAVSSSSSISLCVSGQCQAVGCDDILGSTTTVDLCGVCGGDNSTCSTDRRRTLALYQWRETGYTPCSVSCGLGQEQMTFSCRNLSNNEFIPEHFCHLSPGAGEKPRRTRVCQGSDCHDSRAMWITGEWQVCSRSCDVGRSLRSVYCVLEQNDGTYERTSETLCRYELRPVSEKKCNEYDCPRWIAGQWSHCSASCGVGIQQRGVVCKRTDSLDCVPAEKPPVRRTCRSKITCFHHTEVLPSNSDWDSEADSQALHGIEALSSFGSFDVQQQQQQHLSDLERGNEVAEHVASSLLQHLQPTESEQTAVSEDTTKPLRTSERHEESTSQHTVERHEKSSVAPHLTADIVTEEAQKQSMEPEITEEPQKQLLEQQKKHLLTQEMNATEQTLQPPTDNISSSSNDRFPGYDFGGWGPVTAFEEERTGNGNDTRETEEDSNRYHDEFEPKNTGIDDEEEPEEDKKWLIDSVYRGGPPVEYRKATTVPRYVVSPWGTCSTTCGSGTRRRRVVCKVLLEPSKVVQDLPDYKCEGAKPDAEDYCTLATCPGSLTPKAFSWILTGYGSCSKSCAGGSQDGEFNCLQIPDYYKVDRIRCLIHPVPKPVKRLCNTLPCPPRWNSLSYGPCSVSCGGGQQTRQLQCVQDLMDNKVRVVSESQCHEAVTLPTVASCNLAPCPAKWVIAGWSECSVTCGQGLQTRVVRCEQKLSSHQMVLVEEVLCWQHTNKPETERTCEAGKCHALNALSSRTSVIQSESSHFVQVKRMESIPLLIGTNASLIAGSLIVIHCPLVKGTNRPKVFWKHNDKVIDLKKKRRFRVDKHDNLRIRNSRSSDRGVYSCQTGRESANVTIRFHNEVDSLIQLRNRQKFLNEGEEKKRMLYTEDFMKSFHSQLKGMFKRMRKATYSGHFLINRMPVNSVPLVYVPFQWSACSAECGGGGIQSREVVCTILADEFFLEVDEGYCSDRRFQKPITDRDCGFGRCPVWEAGSWNECSDANCTGLGKGQRRRPLYCASLTGQRLDSEKCKGQPKPHDQEECPHDNCIAVWKPSNWTKCSVSCGRGTRMRSLQCIWRTTKKPAGDLCTQQQKPAPTKSCQLAPCADAGCRDESKYCHMIPGLQMCRFPQYRQECCLSCSLFRANTPPPPSTIQHSIPR